MQILLILGSREPPTSEGSWTTQSEEPCNLSLAPSYTDLHSLDVEDLHSNSISRSASPGKAKLYLKQKFLFHFNPFCFALCYWFKNMGDFN